MKHSIKILALAGMVATNAFALKRDVQKWLCESILTLGKTEQFPPPYKIDVQGVRDAIRMGADVNIPCFDHGREMLPLMRAIDSITIERAATNRADQSAQVVEILLQAGANPNKPGRDGFSATAIAWVKEDPGLLDMLVKYGGEKNPKIPVLDKKGKRLVPADKWEKMVSKRRLKQSIRENRRLEKKYGNMEEFPILAEEMVTIQPIETYNNMEKFPILSE